MELTGYLAVARRWWWTLLVATWVAAMAGLLVASRIAPTYEAQTQLLVGPINTDADTLKASGQLVQTYAQLAISTPLLKSTALEFPGLDPLKLGQSVRTTASDVTRVLQIRVQDSDAARAAQIANTMADELIQLTTGATTRPEGQLEVISSAVPPTTPIAPQVSLIVLLAMAAGLIGGLVLVIVVEYATDMVRDGSDLARLSSTDVLATIAFDQRTAGRDRLPVAATAAPGAANAVAFRLLASKVAFAEGDEPTRVLLVTAVGDGDSAVIATGIAAAIAAGGHRVVVVDGSSDGDITQTLGLTERPGLRESLAEGGPAASEQVGGGPAGIDIMAQGVEGTVDLISVDRARRVLTSLLEDHELVIVDGGAVQQSSGSLTWARVADQTLVTVRRGFSRREDLRLAIESLRYVNARISGTVLVQRTAGRSLRGGGSKAKAKAPAASRPAEPQPNLARDSALDRPGPAPTLSLERRITGGPAPATALGSANAAEPAAAGSEREAIGRTAEAEPTAPTVEPVLRTPRRSKRTTSPGRPAEPDAPSSDTTMTDLDGTAPSATPGGHAELGSGASMSSGASARPHRPS